MNQRRVCFLGHDQQGQAVFQDLEYPSGAPYSTILGTGLPTPNSPDVFRMTSALATYHYGGDYAQRDPEIQARYRDVLERERLPENKVRQYTAEAEL